MISLDKNNESDCECILSRQPATEIIHKGRLALWLKVTGLSYISSQLAALVFAAQGQDSNGAPDVLKTHCCACMWRSRGRTLKTQWSRSVWRAKGRLLSACLTLWRWGIECVFDMLKEGCVCIWLRRFWACQHLRGSWVPVTRPAAPQITFSYSHALRLPSSFWRVPGSTPCLLATDTDRLAGGVGGGRGTAVTEGEKELL